MSDPVRLERIRAIAKDKVISVLDMGLAMIEFTPDPANASDEDEAERLVLLLLGKLDEFKPLLGGGA